MALRVIRLSVLILAAIPLFAGYDVQTYDKLTIKLVKESTWEPGTTDPAKIFESVGAELMKLFPGRKLPLIEVEPKGGPITLFERGPHGEIRVKLAVSKTFWAQYAFQFAHEMGHVLCGYKAQPKQNLWFEESICELSSLFVLRRMSETWENKPPYPNWKSYAPHLKEYAQTRMTKAALPSNTSLAQWYADNAPVLNSNPVDRDRNTVVATALLPLFEADPESWEAVTWLNTEHLTNMYKFSDYLGAWQRNAPAKHRPFIAKIAKQFGITLAEK